ncbi:EAL domain-containing protein [Rhodobacteraceae bacterium WD3A24]|nr:EAL domain-containing protein [Rhodobacteraceae bacterium WD3A24]
MAYDVRPPIPQPGQDFDSPLSAAVAERDRETLDLVRRALDDRNVILAFQPVVQARQPQRVAFHEGLVRVLDPTGRIIPAGDFMGAVETSELGRRIDCLALEMGLIALRRDPTIRMSVNMSARSIGYPRWNETLRDGLRGDASVAERLILEITESSAMLMPDIVTVFMGDLQRQGISFALDDFGAGFTAFRYLREFFFDIVKIDGQFIRGISGDVDNQVLAEALVTIGKHFDMFTVAESVESADDANCLAAIGVDCMQGYFFGAPSTLPPWRLPDGQKSA